MMQWKKDPNLKYTDLCIYIDENITKIVVPGENPDIENKIYNYLWLLVKALAIKKSMFQNFQDYDPYAFYSANRLFFALRKNQLNQGKTIKGKLIRPIKSCLNYTKTLLYPMKIEYQREAYREIIDEEHASKQWDAMAFRDKLLDTVSTAQSNNTTLRMYLEDTFRSAGKVLDTVLEKTPFHVNDIDYKKVKMSVMLNCLSNLKTKKKLIMDSNSTVILWKLPRSMASYIRILTKEFCTTLAKEVIDCFSQTEIDEETAERILNYREGADYEYDDQY